MQAENQTQQFEQTESIQQLFSDFQSIMREFRRMRPSKDLLPEGLTPGEVHIINLVGKMSAADMVATPSFLATHSQASKSAASQLLRSLEGKGLIMRSRSASDARSVSVVLTEEGQALYQSLVERALQTSLAMVDYIGEDEVRQFVGTLRKVWEFQQQSDDFVQVDEPCAKGK